MNLDIFTTIPAAIWVAFFAFIGSVIAAATNTISKRGTVAVENASELTEMAMTLLDEQKETNRNLNTRLTSIENINKELRGRIRSLEENEIMNQRHMMEMEEKIKIYKSTLDDWAKGIEVLIAQIKRHDSRPDWTPYNGEG